MNNRDAYMKKVVTNTKKVEGGSVNGVPNSKNVLVSSINWLLNAANA